MSGKSRSLMISRWIVENCPSSRWVPLSSWITTMHSVANFSRSFEPVGAGLGRFSGYRPYIGWPFRFLRTCRSIRAITVNAHVKTISNPAIRFGFSKNIGVTASGPFR